MTNTPRMDAVPIAHHIDFHMTDGSLLTLSINDPRQHRQNTMELLRQANFVVAVLSPEDAGPYIVLKHHNERCW